MGTLAQIVVSSFGLGEKAMEDMVGVKVASMASGN